MAKFVSSLALLCAALAAFGCAADPVDDSADAPPLPDERATRGNPAEATYLEIGHGENLFLDSKAASVAEWETLEGVAGNELETLFGDEEDSTGARAGGVAPQFLS